MHLTISDIAIPLSPGISLPLVLRSPLFDDNNGMTPGSYIFNLDMDATPELRQVFGLAHRTTRNGLPTAELPYKLQHGTLRYTGTCCIQEATPIKYQIRFNVRNGDFAAMASLVSLKDLDLGGDRPLSANIYSIATNTAGIDIQDWRPGNGPFVYEDLLAITDIVIDEYKNFNIVASEFTAGPAGDYAFKGTFDVGITYGNPGLRIYKNGTLLQEYELLNGLNVIEDAYALADTDILTFKLICYSGLDNQDQDVAYFTISAGLMLEVNTGATIFMEAANGDQESCDYAVFPVENPNFFNNFPADDFKIDNVNIQQVYSQSFFVQNYFNDGKFPFLLAGTKNGLVVTAMNVFTPFVYISYLLNSIASEFGYELVNSPFIPGSDYFNAVLFNVFAENTYTNDMATMINVKTSFNLADHVPDIPVTDFLRNLGKATGRRIDVDTENGTITFVRLRDVIESENSTMFPGIVTEAPTVLFSESYKGYKLELKSTGDEYISEKIKVTDPKFVYKGTVASLNQLPYQGNNVNDMYLVTSVNAFKVWRYSTTTYRLDWIHHSLNFYLTKTAGEDPKLQLVADIAPICDYITQDETAAAPENRLWRIPVTRQAGNFEGYPDMSSEYGLQLLFYQGLQKDSNNADYPLGVSGRKDYTGTVTFDNPNLCLDGLTPNIYTEELEAWLQWLVFEAKPVKLKAIMTMGQLSSLMWGTKYRILGHNYLIKEIHVNLLDDHLSEAEIWAYTS